MKYTIRLETESDFRETENITREAFWDKYKPGCDEHLILHKIRNAKYFVKELDFVICDKNKIIGNIIFHRGKIINDNGDYYEVLCLGPICVLPEYQNQGIGSLLIKESVKKAKQLNYSNIVLTGNPDYYGRFGFRKGSLYNIKSPGGNDFHLVLELFNGSMNGISGIVHEDQLFHVNNNELIEFEK